MSGCCRRQLLSPIGVEGREEFADAPSLFEAEPPPAPPMALPFELVVDCVLERRLLNMFFFLRTETAVTMNRSITQNWRTGLDQTVKQQRRRASQGAPIVLSKRKREFQQV